ncbi:DNA-directed RNA polymerase subunit alpha [Patescibacteria group bacterium]|nr:DNA-directed RNA polymerase subunit alpha [Patescibacteria group bacterium]
MKNIFLPQEVKFQEDQESKNKGFIFVEPCYPGYGLTWGNALRRVLLTSLGGAAVVSVKIKGVKYEFSTIPHVYQDALGIILNLKELRLKILKESEEPLKLKLKAKGEKKVYAADIEKSADVEIVNPDLLIAELTDKKAELDMDIWVDQGYGWIPSEEKKREGLDVGTIVVDSVFTPVLQVSVKVENMRVGGRTDYDRLILGIETDGTLTPLEAGLKAMRLLDEQFASLSALTEGVLPSSVGSEKKSKAKKEVIKKGKEGSKKKKTATKTKAKAKKKTATKAKKSKDNQKKKATPKKKKKAKSKAKAKK